VTTNTTRDLLPALQTGKYLTNDGTNLSWATIPSSLPSGSSNGQVLTWNGSSWVAAAAQSGGTTDGVLNSVSLAANGTLTLQTSAPASGSFTASFAAVAVSGSYSNLSNTPTIQTGYVAAAGATDLYSANYLNGKLLPSSAQAGEFPNYTGSNWGLGLIRTAYIASPSSITPYSVYSDGYINSVINPLQAKTTYISIPSLNTTGIAGELHVTGGVKFANNNVQHYPVISPANPADNDKVLVANGGVFNWADIGIKKDATTQKTTINSPTTIDCVDPTIKQKTQNTLTASLGIAKIAHLAGNLNGQEIELTGIETECESASLNFETGKLKLQSRQTGVLKVLAEMGAQNSINSTKYSSITTTADIEIGKLSGSTTDAGLVFSDSSKQQKAVTNPTTAGHVLTAAANGTWAWAAPVAPGGLSFTPNPIPMGYSRGDRRTGTYQITSSTNVTSSSNGYNIAQSMPHRCFDGVHSSSGAGTASTWGSTTGQGNDSNYSGDWNHWYTNEWISFDFTNAYAVNEVQLYWQAASQNYWGAADFTDDAVIQVWGSNNNSTWSHLNSQDYSFMSQMHLSWFNYHQNNNQFNTASGRIHLHSNINNYRYYKFTLAGANMPGYMMMEFEFYYRKRLELDYI
jgi:hypothetical protein